MANDLVNQLATALQAVHAGQLPATSGRSVEEDIDSRMGALNVTAPWFREQTFNHFTAIMIGVGHREGSDDKNTPYSYDVLLLRTSRGTDVAVRLNHENYKWLRAHFGALREGRYRDRDVVVWHDPTVMMGRDRVGGVRLALPGETPWQHPRPAAPPASFHDPLGQEPARHGAESAAAGDLGDDVIPF